MRVFLDATCWVAAAGKSTGGSAEILRLAREGRLRIVATPMVLEEAEDNIRENLGEEARAEAEELGRKAAETGVYERLLELQGKVKWDLDLDERREDRD